MLFVCHFSLQYSYIFSNIYDSVLQIQAWLHDVQSGTVVRVVADDALNESRNASDELAGSAPGW